MFDYTMYQRYKTKEDKEAAYEHRIANTVDPIAMLLLLILSLFFTYKLYNSAEMRRE